MTAPVHQIRQHFGLIFRASFLALVVLAAWPFLRERPDYSGLADRLVTVTLDPASQASPEGWTLYGAWTLGADDPRVAGLSGLACPPFGGLDMVTDSGSRIVMPFPDAQSRSLDALIESMEGIGDAEAIGYVGSATLVAEEVRHRLRLMEPGVPARPLPLPPREGYVNWGVEALLEPGGESEDLVGLLELGKEAYRFGGATVEIVPVDGAAMRITGATRHRDGRGLVLMRQLGPTGFRSAIAAVQVEGDRVRVGQATHLPLPFNANAEGLCAEPREEGLTRLWIVTDDNGLSALSQRLVAWDVPDAAWPTAP